jgi:hypothetical protein
MSSGLEFVGEAVAHLIGSASRRGIIVVGIALEGERRAGVPGEGLEIPDGLTALGEQAEA